MKSVARLEMGGDPGGKRTPGQRQGEDAATVPAALTLVVDLATRITVGRMMGRAAIAGGRGAALRASGGLGWRRL